MLTTALFSTILAAAAPLAGPQDVWTTRHDDEVRPARPGDEGPLRFAPPREAPATVTRTAPVTDPSVTQGLMYDAATGVETRIDLPGAAADLAHWVEGRGPGHDGSIEPSYDGWTSDLGSISPTSFPWTAQVRVQGRDALGNDFDVSGTLIDPCIVITAGHAVHGGAGGTWHNSIYVYPAWDGDSDAFGSAWGSSYATMNAWVNSSDPTNDVGFIILDRPVGFLTSWFGYGYDTSDSFYSSNYFNLAGYPDKNSCYTGAPDQLYYGFGLWDTVASGLLNASSAWSCDAKGVDGGGAYVILGGTRYVYAIHRDHNFGGNSIEATRLRQVHTDFYEQTVLTSCYSTTIPDYVPLGVQADTGGVPILAGDALVGLDYLFANSSMFDPVGIQTHTVEVYLSTNNNISTFDTLLQTHTFDHDFGPIDSLQVLVANPPVIPANTPSGTYWIGVITKSYDGNSSNNDTDGTDASEIQVTGCNTAFQPFGEGLPGTGGFAPFLYGTGTSCEAGGHTINVVGALGGAKGHLWVGFSTFDLFPIWGGHFYIDLSQPYFKFPVTMSGPAGAPGLGTMTIPGGDVRGTAPLTIYLQVTLLDAGAVQGIALSNAMTMNINP